VFARAKAAANSDHVEWTANFLEVVARMRVYQRQYAAFKPGKPKIDAYNNAEVAGVMIDEMLKHMGIIPGRLPDPVDGLFANFENEGG
jgi:hypothetical protein